MNKSLLLIGCAVFFTGCTVTPPSVQVPNVLRVGSPVSVVPSNSSRQVYYNNGYNGYSNGDDDHEGDHGHGRGRGHRH